MPPDVGAHTQEACDLLDVFEQLDLHGNWTQLTGMRAIALDRRVHLLPWGQRHAADQYAGNPAPLDLRHRHVRPGHRTETDEGQGGQLRVKHVLVELDAVLFDLEEPVWQER